jgi:uncharacterized protein YndB with AHSA1/START domain
MLDIFGEINAMSREVGDRKLPGGDGHAVVLRREYDAAIEDVWDAITDPDRISRWFLPVTGDLRLGGRYQLKGNAGGEIRRCEPPRLLQVTWIFGEDPSPGTDTSLVEVRLSGAGDGRTAFELEHAAVTDPDQWGEYGPGAVGVGWDLGLLGLGLHLRGGSIEDPDAWSRSPEAKELMTRSSEAWGDANVAAGAAEADAASAVANTTRFYSGG